MSVKHQSMCYYYYYDDDDDDDHDDDDDDDDDASDDDGGCWSVESTSALGEFSQLHPLESCHITSLAGLRK